MKTAKAVGALLGTLVTAFSAAVVDEVITLDEAGTLASVGVVAVGGFLTWLGVWRVPNKPE